MRINNEESSKMLSGWAGKVFILLKKDCRMLASGKFSLWLWAPFCFIHCSLTLAI